MYIWTKRQRTIIFFQNFTYHFYIFATSCHCFICAFFWLLWNILRVRLCYCRENCCCKWDFAKTPSTKDRFHLEIAREDNQNKQLQDSSFEIFWREIFRSWMFHVILRNSVRKMHFFFWKTVWALHVLDSLFIELLLVFCFSVYVRTCVDFSLRYLTL